MSKTTEAKNAEAALALAATTAHAAALAQQQADMIARIDERTKQLAEDVKELVSRAEFKPVQSIAYGLVALILTGVVGAILALVITRSPMP